MYTDVHLIPAGTLPDITWQGETGTGACVMNASRDHVLNTLRARIQAIERSQQRPERSGLRLGISAFDRFLPEGRLPAGSVVEVLSTVEGGGATSLALLMAKDACGARKTLVVVDAQQCFYPPAAARLGIDLDRSVVIRPTRQPDIGAAIDLSLRCPAVGAVIGWRARLSSRAFRRFQLAAEIGGGLGLLLRPAAAFRAPSFAALRLLVTPVPSATVLHRIRVDVLRCRYGQSGLSFVLELDDETGHVRVPAEVAPATLAQRAARASG
jgi:protein ImuA